MWFIGVNIILSNVEVKQDSWQDCSMGSRWSADCDWVDEEDGERGATMNVRIVVSVTEIADMNPKDRYVVGGIGEFLSSVCDQVVGHFHGLFVFLMRQLVKGGRFPHVLLFARSSAAPTPSLTSFLRAFPLPFLRFPGLPGGSFVLILPRDYLRDC